MKLLTIKKKRFVLRPLCKRDEKSLQKYANNPKIMKATLHLPYPYTKRNAKEWVRCNLLEYRLAKPHNVRFGIEVNTQIVGMVSLENINGHRAEIGYWLGEPFWGKGIMTEAAKTIAAFGFKKLGLRRIYAFVFLRNDASKRVLEKAGFQREGLLRKHVKKHGKLVDDYIYAKVR